MSNVSALAIKTMTTPYCNKRTQKVCKIALHHAVGKLSAQRIADILLNRPETKPASANYCIGYQGEIICSCPEDKRAFTTSSAWCDQRAITLEVANDGGAPDYHVSDATIESIINLCVDIAQRYEFDKFEFTGDKNGNLVMHKMFAATACPGPYLESKFPYIAEEVSKRLNKKVDVEVKTEEVKKLTTEELADAIISGKFGNGDARKAALKEAGYSDKEIKAAQNLVNEKLAAPKKDDTPSTQPEPTPAAPEPTPDPEKPDKLSTDELAKAIWAGKFGNGDARVKALKDAGYTDAEIKAAQELVNKQSSEKTTASAPELKKGDIVKFNSSATKWASGPSIPSWVKSKTLYVRSTPTNGKCSVSTLKVGAITGTAYIKDLKKV